MFLDTEGFLNVLCEEYWINSSSMGTHSLEKTTILKTELSRRCGEVDQTFLFYSPTIACKGGEGASLR